jgi:hypothetical protein
LYSTTATSIQLAAALPAARAQWQKLSGRSNFDYERLTPVAAQQLTASLNSIIDEKGQLKRTLSLEEQRLILNERTLCRWDARYYWSRYYKIEHWAGPSVGMVLFEPNIAQQIVLDTWAEREDSRLHISQMILKARQEGITTLCEAAVAHRVQFHPNTNAVVGSSRPDKSTKLIDKALTAWQFVPWFLRPRMTRYKAGELIDFGVMHSSINVQHGAKVQSGMARGETPSVAHLTETAEYVNPERDVEAALVKAMHQHPLMFLVLESTAAGMGGWWYNSWQDSKKYWGNAYAPASLQPIFLPYYVARDIYPTETWLRSNPIPADWSPSDRAKRHATKAEAYVRNTPLLARHLGSTWNMPREQVWFWEALRAEHERTKKLNIFYQEMCVARGSRVSTEFGIVPIQNAGRSFQSELGGISRWVNNGIKPIVEINTKMGRKLKVTPDHHILRPNGWTEARYLEKGSTVVLSPPAFAHGIHVAEWQWAPMCSMSISIDRTWAKFLGYFMGDGCWHSDRVIIACDAKDADVIDNVCWVMHEIIGVEPKRTVRGGMVLVNSSNVRWWEMLWNLGMLRERWHPSDADPKRRKSGYKRKVCVPDCIWRSPKPVVREFLSALFECDGHAYKAAAATRFFTKYEDFARDVQLLLLGFGINAIVRKVLKTTNAGVEYPGYEIQLNSKASDLFHETIDFVGARKKSGRRGSHLGRNATKHEMLDTVLELVDAGDSEVYDMTIDGAHRFGANGIMVHNCSDDVECFQAGGSTVFDAELVMSYNSKTKDEPYAIYGVDGPGDEIRPELKPDYREINPNLKPLVIEAQREHTKSTYRLIPLKMDGYPTQFNPTGKIIIWEAPSDGPDYGLGIDTVPVGVGQDRGVIEVLRKATLTKVPCQVAEFASEWVGAADMFPYAHCLAKLYSRKDDGGNLRQPYIVVETNNGGDGCQLPLRKAGWGRMHPWMRYDKKVIDASKASHVGVITTAWSRELVVGYLATALKDGIIDINSPWFIQEMQSLEAGFTEGGRTRIAAVLGRHDDRFMALGWIYLALHVTEFGETRSAFGKGRIIDDGEKPRAVAIKPPAPEELPVAADYMADRMTQGAANWWLGDGMDKAW